ncbi:hypothetical protein AVEN_222384-1 [Araneus ventricosus]|uniref:Uncharacterized protein n=1 Tax=Araneus ventricosus TaxID=182803 RepID=A0A4Y2EGU7_ARAVE|nr:hypothetical protein AVEN_222384-1 [Araneus ventricosus]
MVTSLFTRQIYGVTGSRTEPRPYNQPAETLSCGTKNYNLDDTISECSCPCIVIASATDTPPKVDPLLISGHIFFTNVKQIMYTKNISI